MLNRLEKEKRTMTLQSRVNRMHLVRASLLVVILMAVFASQLSVPSGMAKGTKGQIFDIVPNPQLSTLTAASVKGATFYLEGTIYTFKGVIQGDCTLRPTAEALGTWRAWGTVADSSGRLVLHQTLTFDAPDTPLNATIEVQGVNGLIAPNGGVTVVDAKGNTTGPSEVLAVVGGSGRYSGLSGEAIIRPYCNPTPAVTAPFRFDRAFCLGVE
jgi:hypothetical protein